MLSIEENERLTHVGPGTPMGSLLRNYWFPITSVAELADQDLGTKRVRLLGEDLVLYRDGAGKLVLIGEFCPHRGVSLAYGMIEQDGIRCPYHGWKYDGSGQCVDQPNEPEYSRFKDSVQIPSYLAQEYGGLIFAYMGPLPAPNLPKWDVLANTTGFVKQIGSAVIPCNWLQIMENSVDPVHGEWLHGKYLAYFEDRKNAPGSLGSDRLNRHHVKFGFDPFEYGIIKRRVLEGQTEEGEDWRVGHPLVFPNVLKIGGSRRYELQIRVPVDDTHTYHVWYQSIKPQEEIEFPVQTRIPYFEMPIISEEGKYFLETINGQDIMAWVTQGPIARRENERLGSTDAGLVIYRKMLQDQLDLFESGCDPLNVFRGEENDQILVLPQEENKLDAGLNPSATLFKSWRTKNDPEIANIIEKMAAYA